MGTATLDIPVLPVRAARRSSVCAHLSPPYDAWKVKNNACTAWAPSFRRVSASADGGRQVPRPSQDHPAGHRHPRFILWKTRCFWTVNVREDQDDRPQHHSTHPPPPHSPPTRTSLSPHHPVAGVRHSARLVWSGAFPARSVCGRRDSVLVGRPYGGGSGINVALCSASRHLLSSWSREDLPARSLLVRELRHYAQQGSGVAPLRGDGAEGARRRHPRVPKLRT